MAGPQVLRVTGPIVLDWGNGIRLQLAPLGTTSAVAVTGRKGRKPAPATQSLIEAMQADAASGRPRTHAAYRDVLKQAGHKSDSSAQFIVAREAKRIFGRPLGRGPKRKGGAGNRGGGRKPSPISVMLREKIQQDKAGEGLRDAAHYTRWLVDKANVGLKKVRPIVYRELRAQSPV